MSDTTDHSTATDDRSEDREALRALLGKIAAAINAKDWTALGPFLDPRVVFTSIDQVTSYGAGEVHEYISGKISLASTVLRDVHVDPSPESPALFHDDTCVFTIISTDTFEFRNGKKLVLPTKYTGTLIKRDEIWRLIAIHSGCNIFRNPISYQYRMLIYGLVVLAGVVGVALGWAIGHWGG